MTPDELAELYVELEDFKRRVLPEIQRMVADAIIALGERRPATQSAVSGLPCARELVLATHSFCPPIHDATVCVEEGE